MPFNYRLYFILRGIYKKMNSEAKERFVIFAAHALQGIISRWGLNDPKEYIDQYGPFVERSMIIAQMMSDKVEAMFEKGDET